MLQYMQHLLRDELSLDFHRSQRTDTQMVNNSLSDNPNCTKTVEGTDRTHFKLIWFKFLHNLREVEFFIYINEHSQLKVFYYWTTDTWINGG